MEIESPENPLAKEVKSLRQVIEGLQRDLLVERGKGRSELEEEIRRRQVSLCGNYDGYYFRSMITRNIYFLTIIFYFKCGFFA